MNQRTKDSLLGLSVGLVLSFILVVVGGLAIPQVARKSRGDGFIDGWNAGRRNDTSKIPPGIGLMPVPGDAQSK